jgi:hypothetical protein
MILLPLLLTPAWIGPAQQSELSGLGLPASVVALLAKLPPDFRLAQVSPPKNDTDPAVLVWLTPEQKTIAMSLEWGRGAQAATVKPTIQLASALTVEHSMMEFLAASEDLHAKYGGRNYATVRLPARTEEGKKNLKYRLRLDDLRKLPLETATL